VFQPRPVEVTFSFTAKEKVTKKKALGRTFFLLRLLQVLKTVAAERS
jgi:hypothetical protein